MARLSTAALVLSGLGLPATPLSAQDPFPSSLDAYVAGAVRTMDLPGAAIAVVKDGRVIVVKGYGVRELGKPDPIDAQTIFDIASVTKGFTSAAIASLVDEGKLSWDVPVRTYLPTLEFPDPYVTANATLRDLLSHRTGLASNNSPPFSALLPRARLLQTVKHFEMAGSFREQYNYSNVGFTIAGEAAAVVAGTSWEQLITDRLLLPLGMTRTTADFANVAALGNVAVGHGMYSGVQRPVPHGNISRITTAPAGAVQSSAADLARWMLFQLGDGTWEGRRVLSADALIEMHVPHILARTTAGFRTARQVRHFAGYGMGWQVFDFRGQLMLWHSGNGSGQVAYLVMLPDHRLGVAVLVNSWKAGVQLNAALASRILDHYLGAPERDYVAEWGASYTAVEQRRQEAEQALTAARRQGTRPALQLTQYTGRYRDQLGLTWKVALEADTLTLQHEDGESATLMHWHNDTFRVRWRNVLRADDAERVLFVMFPVSARGTADILTMDPGPFGERVLARREPN